jgi:hypothetical protein
MYFYRAFFALFYLSPQSYGCYKLKNAVLLQELQRTTLEKNSLPFLLLKPKTKVSGALPPLKANSSPDAKEAGTILTSISLFRVFRNSGLKMKTVDSSETLVLPTYQYTRS